MKKKKPHILPVCIIILFIVTAAGVLLYFRNRTQEAFLQLSELSEAAKDEKDIPIPVNPYFDLSVPTYITVSYTHLPPRKNSGPSEKSCSLLSISYFLL